MRASRASGEIPVVVKFENAQTIVIPKRGIVARGICCFAAGNEQIPRPYTWLRNDKEWGCFCAGCTPTEARHSLTAIPKVFIFR